MHNIFISGLAFGFSELIAIADLDEANSLAVGITHGELPARGECTVAIKTKLTLDEVRKKMKLIAPFDSRTVREVVL